MVRSSDFLRAPERATALATLIRQRRLTPSCGGHAPTAERTVGPARMIVESLTPRPGIREQNRHEGDLWPCPLCWSPWGEAARARAQSRRISPCDPFRTCLCTRARDATKLSRLHMPVIGVCCARKSTSQLLKPGTLFTKVRWAISAPTHSGRYRSSVYDITSSSLSVFHIFAISNWRPSIPIRPPSEPSW